MTKFMTTTAVATALVAAGAAYAASDAERMFMTESAAEQMHASDFIGMRVYAQENGVEETEMMGMQDGWEDVGEINDIVITRDGSIEAVLVDLGGFLGVGERQVAMNMDTIQFVSDASTEEPSDFFLVVPASRANLEAAPEYERADMAATGPDSHGMSDAAVEREGYDVARAEDLTTEDLTGARVYDASEEWIGEVSQLTINDGGEIERAIVDVGGFLGLGEKPVALEMDQIDILREQGGDDLRVYVSMTREELEALPTYED